jgi:2-keto-4-pentenoate hydratase
LSKNRRLSPEAIEQAADLLWEARRSGRVIEGLPAGWAPCNLADADAVQTRLFERLGGYRAGWFVGCSNPAIQKQLGLPEPYRAPLLAETVHDSPARLNAGLFPSITLEVEFAFRLGRDIPARERPYDEGDVAEAVESLHPSIEVVTSHLADWTRQPIWNLIADNGTDGALVVGAGRADWRDLELPEIAVSLAINEREERRGRGADVLGNPLKVMTWLANSCRRAGITLEVGQIHNTGSCTAMYVAKPGDRAVARFKGLGEAAVEFVTPESVTSGKT